jgi:hypothetical protein
MQKPKRTIKPAAGTSRITPEEALAAARVVYRDRKTGRIVIVKRDATTGTVKKR